MASETHPDQWQREARELVDDCWNGERYDPRALKLRFAAKLREREAQVEALRGDFLRVRERAPWECEGQCATTEPYRSVHCRTCAMKATYDAARAQVKVLRETLATVVRDSLDGPLVMLAQRTLAATEEP